MNEKPLVIRDLYWPILIMVFFLSLLTTPAESQAPTYLKRSSSAIAVTANGRMLLVVNPDSNSLSLITLDTLPAGVNEITVGVDPRSVAVDDTSQRAYVTNRGSNRVSVVDLVTRLVIANITVGSRPYGVVVSPDGQRLYVTEQGSDHLTILDTATFEKIETMAVPDRPSGLAISNDGRTLYITHLLTNTLTVLTIQPYLTHLPLILKSNNVSWPTIISSSSILRLRPLARPGRAGQVSHFRLPATPLPLWPDSNLVQSIVIAPNGLRAYVPHTRSNSDNPALTLDSTVFPLVSVIDLMTQQHLVGQQFDLATLDPPAVGLPFDATFTPDGTELWVLHAASNDITVIDVAARQRVAHIEVADNPRGIVLSPDGSTAYVNNTLAGTVSVVNTTLYTVTSIITATTMPLSPTLLTGKRLFHTSDDPRLGQDQWMSCNTCHFDEEHDGQTWLLGFAGPRNTSSLLGMSQTRPLRWSGEWDEAADSEFAIRMDSFGAGLIAGTMNCTILPPNCVNHPPNAGRSEELDALAAYLDSLQVPLHPDHADGEPLSPAALRGQLLFNNSALGCANCHPPPLYTDRLLHDVGTATADEKIGPAFNTPSLRGLYDSAPYFHDGSAATLYEAITRSSPGGQHDVSTLLSGAEIQDLITFLMALPFE